MADISLYYREQGKGTPFILLHGNGEDGRYFCGQMDYFSDRYRVIAIDTRGHGKTKRGIKPFTIEQFAEDLDDFISEKSIPPFFLLGFSDGANIAMKFASKRSDKIKALILNGGNISAKGIKRSTQIPIEIGYAIAKRFAAKSEKAKRNMELLRLMVEDPLTRIEDLRRIKAPTLVIAGKRDMVKLAETEEIAKAIPNAAVSIIKGNHFIANKKADAFNKEVERFLASI